MNVFKNVQNASNKLFKFDLNVRRFSIKTPVDLVLEHLKGADKGIAIVGLNRPKQKNAFSFNLVNEIQSTIDQINNEAQARVLLLRSLVPGVFCAGADLKERATMPQEQVEKFVATLRNLMDQIHNLPIPVIAALDGTALGGGLELALACDIRVTASNTKLGLVETKLAIIPGAGGTQRLPRLINPSIAKELIYTARTIDGATAFNLGLVNYSIPQNESGDAAFIKSLELAREILPNGPVAVQMAKKSINSGLEKELDDGLVVERTCYAELIPTEDRIEGLQAFKEKRKPQYKGK